MQKEDLAPHVKEISQVLNGSIDDDQITKELKTFLEVYRVSLETAKRSIIRKYGGNPALLSGGQRKRIGELTGNEQRVDLLVKVISVNKKEIEIDGTYKPILYGIFADESGTASFTAWDADRFDFNKGDALLVRNAYTKEWNGQLQINLGNKAIVERQDADSINFSEIELPKFTETKQVKIAELQEGMNNVTVTGRILSVEKRIVETSDGSKTVYSGVIADATGKTQFSAWHNFELKQNDVITVKGAYVRGWRGIPQLNFGERAEVSKFSGTFPSLIDLSQSVLRTIVDLEKIGGGIDVRVKGVVVDVRDGSGLIFRCPTCKRVIQRNLCRIHGTVEPLPDLRIKAVVDDGESVLTAIMNRKITESLLGMTLDEAMKKAKEMMTPDVVKEEIENKLIAQPIEISGNVTKDEYGLMMVVGSARIALPDIKTEATTLLSELEGFS
ncbi:MAG: hypothetical protein NO474_04175 [Methanomassiliicoccales archaeon]|nr:hypothetical protein [Methanomassiliicoccales archaeon]